MDGSISEFVMYLKHQLWFSKHTIECYLRDVKRLHVFLKSKNIDCFKQVTEAHLNQHIGELYHKLNTSSIHRGIYAIKKLFKFLKREEYIKEDVSEILFLPKKWFKIPVWLTIDEVDLLLETPDTDTKQGLRDRAILETLYGSGIRVSELCDARVQDFNFTERTLRIMGKGSKERIVIINFKMIACIMYYWKSISKRERKGDSYAFLTSRGKRLLRETVWKIIKKYTKLCGIKKNVSPHTLRHSYATHMYHNGASIRVIQELLGHSSIETTSIYMHTCPDHLVDEFNRCHPRD